MKKFNELSRNPDFDFFGNGRDKIAIEKMIESKKENKVMLVDARTKEKNEWTKFGFAVRIATEEIPDRISEMPNDQTAVLFHPTAARASMFYACLEGWRYNDVERSANTSCETAEYIKPGSVLKNYNDLTENRSKEVFE